MFTRARLTRWTKALRDNPEQQITHVMTDGEGGFCCLGKLCEVEGLEPILTTELDKEHRIMTAKSFGYEENNVSHLPLTIAREFGHSYGNFKPLSMPDLIHKGVVWVSAAQANDNNVPWPVIADHFDKYYPCSDEQH